MTTEITIKGVRELDTKLRKAQQAVRTGGRELTRDLGFQARNIARSKAPDGVRPPKRSLKGAIIFRTMKTGRGNEARVWVSSNDMNNLVALRNEFGMKPQSYYIGTGSPNKDLQEWVRKKLGKEPEAMRWITVGGKNSRLGNLNKFWKPTFNTLENQIPRIVEKTFTRRIKRALK